MNRWKIIIAVMICLTAQAEVIDRIAIVVGKQIIKDSDIQRDIRVTSFLNGEQPDFQPASLKQAASRLIDQAIIREQVRAGEFPQATSTEADSLLAQTKKERYRADDSYKRALAAHGINEAELRDRLLWQLTVLHFIDARFRPMTNDPQQVTQLLNEWLDQSRKQAHIQYLEKELQ